MRISSTRLSGATLKAHQRTRTTRIGLTDLPGRIYLASQMVFVFVHKGVQAAPELEQVGPVQVPL